MNRVRLLEIAVILILSVFSVTIFLFFQHVEAKKAAYICDPSYATMEPSISQLSISLLVITFACIVLLFVLGGMSVGGGGKCRIYRTLIRPFF